MKKNLPYNIGKIFKLIQEYNNSEKILKEFRKTHNGSNKIIHACPYCSQIYKNQPALRAHERRIHTGEGLHPCSHCLREFAGKSDLLRHERTHTGEKPHKCSHCSREFTQIAGLQHHERACHTKERPHKCPYDGCSYAAARKDTLNRHIRAHHT